MNSTIRLSGSTTFMGNSAVDSGGGIDLTDSNVSSSGSTTFISNSANGGGGTSVMNSKTSFIGNTSYSLITLLLLLVEVCIPYQIPS